MKIDFYRLVGCRGQYAPDLEHELPTTDAVLAARVGQVVLVKVWLRTDGAVELEGLEARLAQALAPLGLK